MQSKSTHMIGSGVDAPDKSAWPPDPHFYFKKSDFYDARRRYECGRATYRSNGHFSKWLTIAVRL